MTRIPPFHHAVLALAGVLTLSAFVPAARGTTARRHVRVTKSTPARNDTLTAAPTSLQLWFDEGVALATTHIKLADASGTAVALAAPQHESMAGMDDKDMPVTAAVTKAIGAGSYTISWDAVAKDGEASKGTIKFVVR